MDDKLKTLLVALLYSEFSEETWAAGWYSGAANCIPDFKEWLRKRLPLGLTDYQNEDMPALMEAFSQILEEISNEPNDEDCFVWARLEADEPKAE